MRKLFQGENNMINRILKTMRKKANYTQNELAKKCNIANTTLSGYESSYREPTFETIEKIAEECGYEVIFQNKTSKEILTTKNINRKEI